MRAAVIVDGQPMRPLILAIWALCLALAAGFGLVVSPAYADCSAQAFWTWPPANTPLPPNGVILLTGYGNDQAAVEGIASLKPALTSEGGDVIPLTVIETRHGAFSESQVLLRAASPLSPTSTYHLTFTGAPAYWDYSLANAKWSVKRLPDTSPPTWTASPASAGGERVLYGCGPGVTANVTIPVRDDDPKLPLLLDVTLTDPSGGIERMWVEATQGGTVSLGHGMCSGHFAMSAPQYSATFTALDLAANATPAPGGPITLTTP